MKFPEERYYRLNYILLSLIGLCPYNNSIANQIQVTLSILIFISFISVQLTKLFYSEYNLDLLLEVLCVDVQILMWTVKYVGFYIVMQKISSIPKRIRSNWNILIDDQEIDIMHKHANTSKLYTIIIATSVYSGIFIFILLQYVPSILDIVMPLNASRMHRLFIQTEYFVDQQKHFYILAMHINIGLLVIATAGIATETFGLAVALHCFGMFKVASYRMEHMLEENAAKQHNTNKRIKFYDKITAAVEVHRKAIEFSEMLRNTLGSIYLVMLTIALCSACLNLFFLSRLIVMVDKRLIEIYKCFASLVFLFMYLIFGNYVGQTFMNCDYRVHQMICNTQWYNAPVKTQKLIYFLLQKTTKTYKVYIGGMFNPGLEGLASTMSLILSIVTVFCSVQ